MSLQVWLPLNQGSKNVICGINEFIKEGGITVTDEGSGWYKMSDSTHTSSGTRWGIYKDFYVKSNTTYTLNVYCKSTTGISASIGIQSFNGYTAWPAQRESYNGTSEKLITYTWTTAATDNYARVYLALYPNTTVADNYVFYKGIEILEAPEIKNQGVAEVVITNDGADYESNGKIGGCYNLTNGPINISNLPNPSEISISFWFKRTANTNTRQFMFTAWSGVTCELTTDGKPTFAVYRSNYPTITGTTAITTSTGWVHYCGTFNSTNGMKMYINGELAGSNSNTTAISWSTTVGQIGKYSSYASMSAQINDFRIYDNALSAEEVKKLSQGLVLHYPLNRRELGQENLIRNTDFGGISQKYTVTSGTEGGFTYTPTETIVANTEYIVSCRLRGNANMNLYKLCTGGNEALNWVNRSQLSTTEYRPFSIVFTYPSSKTLNQIYICTRYGTANTSTGDWFEIEPYSLKLEKGSIATPWSPSSLDTLYATLGLNSTTEYDTSGFGNHGTRYGTFTYSSDTPKYHVSTYASGSTTTYLEGPVLPAEAKTVSLWIKANKSSNGAIFNDKTSGLQIGLLNSLLYMVANVSTAGFTTTHWVDGQWNHVVAVNNNGTRSLYVNGQAETQSGGANYYIHNADNCWLWNRSYNNNYPFTGSLSDLQVYATALSAEDVLALYNNKNF